jgi:hypothetical protein
LHVKVSTRKKVNRKITLFHTFYIVIFRTNDKKINKNPNDNFPPAISSENNNHGNNDAFSFYYPTAAFIHINPKNNEMKIN